MKTIPANDIIRKSNGETQVVPVDNAVIGERKFSLAGTTDKMGITTGGAIAKGFIWGLMIGAFAVMAVGMYAGKINLSYSK
jgi:uncharacterized membrane protein